MNRKPIFDRVRAMLGRGFRKSEVTALDMAIDAAFADPIDLGPTRVPTVSKAGVDLIKEFEGCRLKAYPDPGTGGAPWTIGYGATMLDGIPVSPGLVITQEDADELLAIDVERHADDVRKYLGTAPTSQGQFDALVSFHFNTGDLGRSTLLRKHLAGDYDGAAEQFGRWIFAGGRKLNGLVRRRKAEAALYRS